MTQENATLEERARKACVKYLGLKHYNVLDENFYSFVIAKDMDNVIHVIYITISDVLDDVAIATRKSFEQAMISWLAEYDDVNVDIVPDVCNFVIIGEDRVLVKHCINVQELM